MKNKILIAFLLLCLNTFGQYPNLSGVWNGTIKDGDKTSSFSLDIRLKDECNLQYYVFQQENTRSICKYAMIQSKNVIIRDVGALWNDGDGSGPAIELRLTYDGNNRLIGYRLRFNEVTNKFEKEIVNMFRNSPSSFLKRCPDDKIIKEKETKYITKFICPKDTSKVCFKLEDKLPENVFDKQLDSSQVYLKILDNNTEDGDKVTVFLNENKLLNQATIYKNLPYCIPLSIKGSNIISWCSCNNGTFGNNTGKIIIEEYLHKDLVQLKEYDIILDKNQQYKILIY